MKRELNSLGCRVRFIPPKKNAGEKSRSFVVKETVSYESLVERIGEMMKDMEFYRKYKLTEKPQTRFVQILSPDRTLSTSFAYYVLTTDDLYQILYFRFPLMKGQKMPKGLTPPGLAFTDKNLE